ncbi:MAG TPA: 3-deoxy-D-manno-octulosonic acid transferase [Pyrinomonadaceae bacterium]|nr:3-deoxy-D-manno-octulosonic acid transferase [Pyrinomonadaceae bacterium]
MYPLYSLIFSLGFLLMLPMFLLRREKYASGFKQRLGTYSEFKHDGREVIWLHCVSVGETNAARPLVDALRAEFPEHRLVISTTTKTGHELARKTFADKADAVVYFPFDWKFSVRRALSNFKPSIVLLMETEIWPRFIHEAKQRGAKVAIVNGRLSKKSFDQYSRFHAFISRVLGDIDLALMQSGDDADAIKGLGVYPGRVRETGNIKFDLDVAADEVRIADHLRRRFSFGDGEHLILAASTHSPEEALVLRAFGKARESLQTKARLLIAPRHPERFDEVEKLVRDAGLSIARRSETESISDKQADVVLLDSIGELRGVLSLGDIVFIGGSLIAHGGQSVLEPAAFGKAIITGPHTHNFDSIVKAFLRHKALIQLDPQNDKECYIDPLTAHLVELLVNPVERESLGRNAKALMDASRGATIRTVEMIKSLKAS